MTGKQVKAEYKQWFNRTFDEPWLSKKENNVLPDTFKTIYSAHYWPKVRETFIEGTSMFRQKPFEIRPYHFFHVIYEPEIVDLYSILISISNEDYEKVCEKLK